MNVIHLCSYYYGSKLYENLVSDLNYKGINQKVYVPVKKGTEVSNANDFGNCEFLVRETSENIDRLFFKRKFNKNYKTLIRDIDIKWTDIVHAHTLFTNGAMAYRLYKEFNIPYIVAVRNTDVNVFFKYFIHLRKLGVDILLNAKKVIFISPAYMENTINIYIPKKFKTEIREKSLVIPNGLNEYWLKNREENGKKLDSSIVKLVYAGEITKNKNIHRVINDIDIMIKKGQKIEFNIVGDGEYLEEIKKLVNDKGLNDNVKIYGRINDKDKLRDILRENHIFVMISTFETFGLSYIEALSQGLPVLYTYGQGIYGYFKEGEVGFAVKLNESIEPKIEKIKENYLTLSDNAVKVIDEFKWSEIGNKYYKIYKEEIDK